MKKFKVEFYKPKIGGFIKVRLADGFNTIEEAHEFKRAWLKKNNQTKAHVSEYKTRKKGV